MRSEGEASRGDVMAHEQVSTVEETLQKTYEWIRDVKEISGRWDSTKAFKMLRAMLHVLRDRLTVDEAAHLGAQLPAMVRGFYYEGWKPAAHPSRIRSKEELWDAISEELNDPQVDPQQALEAVLTLLNHRITRGELDDIRAMLPPELRELWPST